MTIQMKDLMKKIYFADECYSRIEIELNGEDVNVFERLQNTYDPNQELISFVSTWNNDNRRTFCDECNSNLQEGEEELSIEECFEFFLDDYDARHELEEEIVANSNYGRDSFNFVW